MVPRLSFICFALMAVAVASVQAAQGALFLVLRDESVIKIAGHQLIQLRSADLATLSVMRKEVQAEIDENYKRMQALAVTLEELKGAQAKFAEEVTASLQMEKARAIASLRARRAEAEVEVERMTPELRRLDAENAVRHKEQTAAILERHEKARGRVSEIDRRRAAIGAEIIAMARKVAQGRNVYDFVGSFEPAQVTSYLTAQQVRARGPVSDAYVYAEREVTLTFIKPTLPAASEEAKARVHLLMDEVFALVVEKAALTADLGTRAPEAFETRSPEHRLLASRAFDLRRAIEQIDAETRQLASTDHVQAEVDRRWATAPEGVRQAAVLAEAEALARINVNRNGIAARILSAYMTSGKFPQNKNWTVTTNADGQFALAPDAMLVLGYYHNPSLGNVRFGWLEQVKPGQPLILSQENAIETTDESASLFQSRMLLGMVAESSN